MKDDLAKQLDAALSSMSVAIGDYAQRAPPPKKRKAAAGRSTKTKAPPPPEENRRVSRSEEDANELEPELQIKTEHKPQTAATPVPPPRRSPQKAKARVAKVTNSSSVLTPSSLHLLTQCSYIFFVPTAQAGSFQPILK